MDSARVFELTQALHAATAADLGNVVAGRAKALFGASDVDLLVIDYRSSSLSSAMSAAEPLAVDSTPAGRVFASQQSASTDGASGGYRALLPVTARGNRIGVLALTLPQRPDPEVEAELAAVATTLGHELVAADYVTDAYRRVRRSARLTLAAEMQWDTLPGRGVATSDYAFSGQLEPAYAVCGDTFDWASDADGLTVAVLNGMNEGMPAAMLTSFAISALRNARRSGDDIAEQAAFASDMMYSQYGGESQLATLLLRYEPGTGTLLVVDAGSPLLLRVRSSSVELIELDHQLPLGMSQETRYVEQRVPVRAGDRLVVVSDGVHAAVDSNEQAYSVQALASALRRTRMQPSGEAIRTVIRDVISYHGTDLDDDAVVVALDIH